MKIHIRLVVIAVLIAFVAAPANAQVTTSLAIAPGVATGASDTGVALAAAISFDLADRVTVEGTVGMANRGPGAGAVYAVGGLLFQLLPPGRLAVPYVAVGGGLYRAMFDLNHQRFFGGMGSTYAPGTVMTPLTTGMHGFGMMGGNSNLALGTFYPGQMPAFYAQRMGVMSVPANNAWGMRGFTDPAVSIGGGVTIGLTERWFLRPDARALVVFGNGGSSTVAVVTVGFGYRL
ncbi:MAG: hypothetical protein Q8O42_06555 [Acidobacteriota bacterium]|nr:hypothetical protein [Acidobacteriota bacterium]